MKKSRGLIQKIIIFSFISLLVLSFSFACKKTVKGAEDAKAALSGNNYLKYIGFSSKVDDFKFEPSTKSYSVKLMNSDVDKIALSAFAQDEKARVNISPSGEVSIATGGSVKFSITCTAQNGSVREVKVEVRREEEDISSLSNNSFLKSVEFSSGTLMQEFNRKKVNGYTVLLSASEGSTRILALPEDETSTITYVPSQQIEVSEGGQQECKVVCTAKDGKTKKEYIFNISRESEEEIPELIDIVVGRGETLSPAFQADHFTYSCLVANNVASVKVKGIPLNKNATVEVTPPGDVSLTPNVEETFTIKVSLPAKPTEIKTYSVKVKRDIVKDDVATLSSLTLKGDDGTIFPLSPNFSSGVKEYTASIYKNFEGFLNLEGTPTSSNANVQVFSLPTNLGKNAGDTMQMKCVVTAQAGNKETYIVVATRSNTARLSKDATLKSLSLKNEKGEPIALSPSFASGTFAYTAKVPFHFKGKVKAQYEPNHRQATATSKAEPAELAVADNAQQTITVTVTAEDTSVKKDYVVVITREAASDDADLIELHLKREGDSDDVPLTPPFSPDITEYTATVPITTARVRFVWKRKVETSSTNPEYPMEFVPYIPHQQDNPFILSITVTAQSGAKKTYRVKISSPAYEDPIKMVTVINSETTVNGSGDKGVFIQGRTVKIAPYKMSETEVPFIAYKQVLDWAAKNGFAFGFMSQVKKGSIDEDEKEPACGVKWNEAVIWCNAYSAMTNKEPCYTKFDGTPLKKVSEVDNTIKLNMEKNGYRLPTEVEWEFAARGGRPNEEAWNYKWAGVDASLSDDPNVNNAPAIAKIGDFVWHWGNAKTIDDSQHKTHIPKLKKSTNHDKGDDYPKIYDLSGNIAEWVWDRKGTIQTTTPVTGNETGEKHFLRGGFCYNLSPQGVVKELEMCMVTERLGSFKFSARATEAGIRLVCKN